MTTVFLGEGGAGSQGSYLTSVSKIGNYTNHNNNKDCRLINNDNGQLNTPPEDDHRLLQDRTRALLESARSPRREASATVTEWLEVWDYVGGSSFRAFIAEDGDGQEKTLFAFFDSGVAGHDLTKAYAYPLYLIIFEIILTLDAVSWH